MIPEASLEDSGDGLVPRGDGWFVVNTREARWREEGPLGRVCFYEGDVMFPQLGINVNVIDPGESMCMYHWENDQEDFLVVAGEAVLIVEGQERRLKPWDFVHCPLKTAHVIVGAGQGPCVVIAVGARSGREDWGAYAVDETALKYGAGVERETSSPEEAYARFPERRFTRYRDGWLPDLS